MNGSFTTADFRPDEVEKDLPEPGEILSYPTPMEGLFSRPEEILSESDLEASGHLKAMYVNPACARIYAHSDSFFKVLADGTVSSGRATLGPATLWSLSSSMPPKTHPWPRLDQSPLVASRLQSLDNMH